MNRLLFPLLSLLGIFFSLLFYNAPLAFLFLFILSVAHVYVSCHRSLPLEALLPKYANKDSKFVEVQGMKVHYRDQVKEGLEKERSNLPVIILLHGTSASLHTWETWVKTLTDASFRVLSLDLPGYGLTGPFPNNSYSQAEYSAFMRDFFNALGVKKLFGMVGNSLGGRVCLQYTVDNPLVVERLILVDSVGPYINMKNRGQLSPVVPIMKMLPDCVKRLFCFYTPRFLLEDALRNVYYNPNRISQELYDRYMDMMLREGNREAFIFGKGKVEDEELMRQVRDKIQKMKHPVLLMWGIKDDLTPVDIAYKLYDDLQNSQMVVYLDAGHVPMEELPELSAKEALLFFQTTKDDAQIAENKIRKAPAAYLSQR